MSLTIDRQADSFNFTDLTSQALSTAVTSNTVTVSGINSEAFLQVTAGASALTSIQASIDGGAFTTVPAVGTYTLAVKTGQTIQVKATTGAANSTAYTATFTLGDSVTSVTDVWSVTTAAAVASITTPSITSPASGSTSLNPANNSPTGIPLVGSTYTPLNGAGATQTSSTWEVYTWVGGASPVAPTLEPPGANYTAVTGSPFTVSSAPFTTYNIAQSALTTSSTYYARVKYATTNATAATSSFSSWSSFATASSFVPTVGAVYGGGYFGGQINISGTIYNLVVAPVEGNTTGPVTGGALKGQYGGTAASAIQYKTSASADAPSATVQDDTYGGSTTDLFKADAAHPVFNTFINGATGPNAGAFNLTTGGAGGGTGIGGFNDWYLPAKNELEILYYNLKPDTTANVTSSGINPNSVPARASNYTAGSPAQTTNTLFQSGGTQAFSTANGYWSSTEYSSSTTSAWRQSFNDGLQNFDGTKSNTGYARAVRREPA